jgi:HEAT repeat protein
MLLPVGLLVAAELGGLTVWLLLGQDEAPREPEKRPARQETVRPETDHAPEPKAEPKAAAKPDPDLQARTRSRKNLAELALAFHNFHDANQKFPPAALAEPWSDTNRPPPFDPRRGPPPPKTLLSWRVLLLPFLGEERLFREFHLSEPWDSPHNKKLLARMPTVYAPVRGKTPQPHMTYYQVFVGPDAPFQLQAPPARPAGAPPDLTFGGPSIARIADGTSNTFLMVEAGEPVPWTKPADLPYDAQKPLPKLGGLFPDGFHAAFFDAEVFFVPRTVNEKVVRAFITSMGGEVVSRDDDLPKPPAKKETRAAPAKPNADHWLRLATSPDAVTRREAVQALARFVQKNPPAKDRPEVQQVLAALAQAMSDPDPEVARQAKKGLGLVGDQALTAVPALLGAYPDDDALLFREFAKWLRQGGPDAVRGLLAALRHDDFRVRARAAYLLKEQAGQDKKVLEALQARYERLNAAAGVDKDSPELLESVLALLEALHEKYDHPTIGSGLRSSALAALSRIGPVGRVAVADLFWSDDLSAPLVSAEMALAAAGAPLRSAGLAGLADALGEAGPRLRARLAPRVVPELVLRLQNPRGRPLELARALGEFGPAAEEAVPALLPLVRNPQLLPEAAWALSRIGGPAARQAVPYLKRLLEEQRRLARDKAAPRDPAGRVWLAHPLGTVPAADALLRLDPGQKKLALAALRDALDSFNPAEAALTLLEHGVVDAKVFEALLPKPQDLLGQQQSFPADRLRRLTPQTQKALREVGRPLLRSTDAAKRHAAALVLAPLDPDACLPVLIEILKQGGAREVSEAAKILAALGPKAKAAFPQLRKRLEEPPKAAVFFTPDPQEVIHAVARIDPDGAVPVLWKLWRDPPKLSGKDRFDAAASLGSPLAFWELVRLGPRVKAVLPQLLTDLKAPGKDDQPLSWFYPAPHGAAQILLAKVGPPALPALRDMLKESSAAVQARAAQVLGRMGPEARAAAPDLVRLVGASDARVRRAAVAALGRVAPRDRDVMAALTGTRKDKDPAVRREMARALGGAGPEVIPLLADALTDPDENGRLAAVGALGRLGPQAVDPLRSALGQKSVQVRRLAVLAFGRLGPDAAGTAPALLEATRDGDGLVRRLAVSLLDRPGKDLPRVAPALARALADEEAAVRWTAAFVCEELGRRAREALPALEKALGEKESAVRRRVLFAVRALGPAARPAVPVLVKLLDERNPVPTVAVVDEVGMRADVALALGRIAPDPVALFTKLLKSSAPATRTTAAEALVQIGRPAVPALLTLARRGETEIRKRAVFCLGQIAPPPKETVPALVELLGDNNLVIRLEAVRALAELGPDARAATEPLSRIARDNQDLARQEAAKALERIKPAYAAAPPR